MNSRLVLQRYVICCKIGFPLECYKLLDEEGNRTLSFYLYCAWEVSAHGGEKYHAWVAFHTHSWGPSVTHGWVSLDTYEWIPRIIHEWVPREFHKGRQWALYMRLCRGAILPESPMGNQAPETWASSLGVRHSTGWGRGARIVVPLSVWGLRSILHLDSRKQRTNNIIAHEQWTTDDPSSR